MNIAFYIIIIILALSLLVFLIWNAILYKQNIKNGVQNNSNEYYELKYQLQFYIAIFSTIIGVFSFLGYEKYNDIEKNVKEEITKKSDSIVSSSKKNIDFKIYLTQKELDKVSFENQKINEFNKKLSENNEKTNDRFYSLYTQFLNLNKELIYSENKLQSQINNIKSAEKDVDNIKSDIIQIKKIDFLNQVYLVVNCNYDDKEFKNPLDTIYFKNLKTISNNNLPLFKSPPSLIISTYKGGGQLSIRKVTKDFYILGQWTKTTYDGDDEKESNSKYDILIIYKENL